MKKNTRKPRKLDRTDRLILKTLQEDGRISNVALAKKVNLSATPCMERVRRLERQFAASPDGALSLTRRAVHAVHAAITLTG